MSARQQQRAARIGRTLIQASILLTSLSVLPGAGVSAQEAIGVPFVGSNHLSFYTTELSRDGVGQKRAAIFGGAYGHRFGNRDRSVEISAIVRAGARSLDGPTDGILDTGGTLAATRSVPGLSALSLTGAAGVGVVLWGQEGPEATGVDRGRMSTRVPLSAGAAYDVRIGGARIAPFAMLATTYSREADYVDDKRIALNSGWRVGYTTGVSVRFEEMVLSLADVHRERGLPHDHRLVFSVGMSW